MYIDYKLLGKVRPTVEGDWDIKKEYKLLSIVFDTDSNKSYISKKDVPIGISILNKEYWGRFSNNRIDSDSIIILSHKNGLGQINSYTLEEAIATISDDDKRIGMFISFYEKPISADGDYRWNMYQFNSDNVEDWNNVNYWSSIYYIKTKFFGLQETEEALYGVRINPDIGDYAFVGMTLKDAVIYRCRTKNVWTRTEEPAIDYITVMLKGNITVGPNGNWFENGVDTGIKAQGPKGDKGDSIKGDKGDTPVMRLDKSSGYVQYGYDGIHWENLVPLTEFVINNNPDDEDIIVDDNDKLKFADKSYDAAQFSGLGRKYLRRNIQQGKNVLTQDMINQENTIYIIQYDYDLNSAEITIPANCTLQFEGGSLSNGKLNSNDSIINSKKEIIFKNIDISSLKIRGNCYSNWFYNIENDNILLNNVLNCGAQYIELKKDIYNISTKILLNEQYELPDFGSGIILDDYKSHINFNNSIFKLVPTNDSHFSIMYITNSNNLLIENLNIIGDKKEHLINTGQWSYGIGITYDCKDITIKNNNISECYGDCICIENNIKNSDNYKRAENIKIINNYLGNCLRNNISCIGGKNILIQNNIITRIDSAPNSTDCNAQLFIDIESNYSYQNQDNIQILNNYCYCNKLGVHDCSGGISVRNISYNNDIIIADNKLFNCWYYGINVGSLNIDANIQIFNNYIDNIEKDSIIIHENISPYISNNIINRGSIGKYNEKTKVNNSSFTNIKEGIITTKGIFINCYFKNSIINNKLLFDNSELYDCKFINIKNENVDTIDLGYCIALTDSILSNIDFINCSGYCILNQYGGNSNFSNIKFYNCKNKIATYYNTIGKNININNIEFINCERYNILCLKRDDAERQIFINNVIIKDSIEDTTKQTRYISICDGQTLPINNFIVSNIIIYPSNYYKQINSGDYIIIGKSAKCNNFIITNAEDKQKESFYNIFNDIEANEIYFNGEKIIGSSLIVSSLNNKLFSKNIVTPKFYKENNNTYRIPIWNISQDGNTAKWINALGNPADAKNIGTFSEKPLSSTGIPNGFAYFCTDKQTTEGQSNGIMIYHKGSDVWVDALGRTIS